MSLECPKISPHFCPFSPWINLLYFRCTTESYDLAAENPEVAQRLLLVMHAHIRSAIASGAASQRGGALGTPRYFLPENGGSTFASYAPFMNETEYKSGNFNTMSETISVKNVMLVLIFGSLGSVFLSALAIAFFVLRAGGRAFLSIAVKMKKRKLS